MKTMWKNRSLLFLLALMLNFGFVGALSTPTYAAEMTKEQKAKAAAKAKAAKEKEKAKAAKAKEKAKAQAAKEKEKAQAAKEKEKAQAAKEKEKAQAATPVKPSKEEVYEQKLAEIEKYNAYVSRYMSRDITHRLGFWGQVGYSNLLNKGMSYDADTKQGFDVNSKGGVGGGGGLGYQLRYRDFLFTVGAEMQVYSSLYQLSTTEPGVITRTFGMVPYTDAMCYTYEFSNSRDRVMAGFVQLPVLFGMEFANHRGYFQVGPKVGLGVMGKSKISADRTTWIDDAETVDPYMNMPTHTLLNNVADQAASSLKWGLNLALYGEIGMSLDPWMNTDKVSTRLAVFAEYGVLNAYTNKNVKGMNDQPVDYTGTVADAGNVLMVSSLSTTTAATAVVNPLLAGVKATVWFNLPRKQLKYKKLPKEPNPAMCARVLNADDNKVLSGAVVTVTNDKDVAMAKTTNGKGMINIRLPKGDYQLKAERVGFYPDSVIYSLVRSLQDTIDIRLRPEPKPIVYTYAGRVFAEDTNEPVEAEVQVLAMANGKTYQGETTEDGLFVTNFLAGDYITHIRCQGFMPKDDTVHFEQDTLQFFLTRIKPGVKVKIENLYFATNRTYILPESESSLQDLAGFLTNNPTVRIRIIGHTDAVGSDRANQILSEGRAKSLRLELIKRGVDANRIEAIGRGESEPVADNETEEGRALNRRVEFMIIDTGGADVEQIH